MARGSAGAALVASDEGAARTWECTRRFGKVALAYMENMYDSTALGEAGQAVGAGAGLPSTLFAQVRCPPPPAGACRF